MVQNVDHDNVSNRFAELSTAVPAVVVCHSDDLIEEETSSIADSQAAAEGDDPSIEDDCFIVENEQTYELTQEMRVSDIKTDISTTNRIPVVNAPKPDQTANGKHCDIRPVKKHYNRSSVGNPTVDSRGGSGGFTSGARTTKYEDESSRSSSSQSGSIAESLRSSSISSESSAPRFGRKKIAWT